MATKATKRKPTARRGLRPGMRDTDGISLRLEAGHDRLRCGPTEREIPIPEEELS